MVWKNRLSALCNAICNTLTGWLVTGMVIIHLLLLPLLFGAVFYLIKESYETQFVEHIRSTAPLYAQMVGAEDEEAMLIATLDEILLSGQVTFVELETTENRLVRSSMSTPEETFNEDFFFGQHGDHVYYIAIPVQDAAGPPFATLRLGYSEHLTLEQIGRTYRSGIAIIIGYFVLSTFFVVLISIILTRSIRQIGETSQAIAQGDLEQAFAVRTNIGEVNQLVDNLEHMRMTLLQDRQEIQDRETRIQAIVANMAEGVVTINDRGIIESFNQAAEQIFGYRADEVIGNNISMLMSASSGAKHDEYIRDYLRTGVAKAVGQRNREVMGRHKDGHGFPLELAVSELTLGGRRVFSGILRDITERAAQKALLEYQATHDALTGLPNRMLCRDRLQQMLARSRRDQTTSALMLLDLNLFKDVNDAYGHEYGDALLKAVAERLQTVTRGSDTVARIGGDEFVILLPDQDAEGATSVAKNILDVIRKPFNIKGQALKIGTSIGIALYPRHGEDEHHLMRNADKAMYKAKRHHLGYHLSGSDQAPSKTST